MPSSGFPLRRLPVRSLRSVGRDAHLVLDPLRLVASVPQAAWWLVRNRPAAIFTTGGYMAIPVLVAAWLLRIPVVLWDGNVVPGRSVRATARLAGAVAVTDPRTCTALAARRCYETGTPIRDPRTIDREAAREGFSIPAGERLILVFGGSQAVQRFSDAVAGALPTLVERHTVLHVTGDAGYAAALAAREALPEARRDRYRPVGFLADEMTAALAAADLVVGRAGASTLAECAAFGLPLVCVPYPHAAGHQRVNAEAYAASGAARLVADEAFDAAALLDAVHALDDPAAHLAMSAAARAAGRPGAAAAVAELVAAAGERRPWPDAAAIERIAAGGNAR